MHQPPGFVDPLLPQHVCKLRKFLYGLRQAPRQWYLCLSNALLRLGFMASKTDTSLYYYNIASKKAYCLIYVDDILITGNYPYHIRSIITSLNISFRLKDLGVLHYFLEN